MGALSTRERLAQRAVKLARVQAPGAPKDLRIARAKRSFELQLRAAGFSRAAAKHAVRVKFGSGENA